MNNYELFSDFAWSGEVEDAINEAIASAKAAPAEERLAVFDFDNTMIKNDCGDAYLCRVCMSQTLPDAQALFDFVYNDSRRRDAVKALYDEGDERFAGEFMSDYDALYRSGKSDVGLVAAAFATLKKTPSERKVDVEKIAGEIFSSSMEPVILPLKDGKEFVYKASARPRVRFVELVESLREAGITPIVISATYDELVKFAAKKLFGIDELHAFGLKLSRDQNGVNLPNPVKPLTWDVGKPLVWKRHFGSVVPELAFGDSSADFPLMKLARKGIAICPEGGGEIEKQAEACRFLIQRVEPE